MRRHARIAWASVAGALAVAFLAPPVRAAAIVATWLPVAGASGYRIERATSPAGPWKLYRDVAPAAQLRPADLQAVAVDGFRAKGVACVRVSTIWQGPVYSTPTEAACVTLPRASVDFSTLGNAPPAPPKPPTPAPISWAYCAGENEVCVFNGKRRVRFGIEGAWAEATLTNGAACSVAVFGDPIRGQWKYCEVEQ